MQTSFSAISGRDHVALSRPCQDFALAAHLGTSAYAIVADGCSTGGRTELGARAWSLVAAEVLGSTPEPFESAAHLQEAIVHSARDVLSPFPAEDGLSTVLVAKLTGKRLQVAAFGDGVVITRHLDGTVTLVTVHYDDNAPWYLNYLLHPDTGQDWRNRWGRQKRTIVNARFASDGALEKVSTVVADSETPLWLLNADVAEQDIDLCMVATDGLGGCGSGLYACARALAGVESTNDDAGLLADLMAGWAAGEAAPDDDVAVAALWLS